MCGPWRRGSQSTEFGRLILSEKPDEDIQVPKSSIERAQILINSRKLALATA